MDWSYISGMEPRNVRSTSTIFNLLFGHVAIAFGRSLAGTHFPPRLIAGYAQDRTSRGQLSAGSLQARRPCLLHDSRVMEQEPAVDQAGFSWCTILYH